MKKFLCLILCMMMLIPALPSSYAAEKAFTDVRADAWYAEAVYWNVERGYFSGTSDTTFSPNGLFTRAQIVTVLGQIAGIAPEDYEEKHIPFDDVEEGKYYTPYIIWAQEKGVVSGKSESEFAPRDPVTRQEICVIFMAFVDYKDLALAEVNPAPVFADGAKISSWAKEAVISAAKAGLITGDNYFNVTPKDNCSRKEAAQIVKRLVESLATATPEEKPMVVAYMNASTQLTFTEFEYIDVINYHPAVVSHYAEPYIHDVYSWRFESIRETMYAQNPDIKVLFTIANNNLQTFERCLYPYENLYAFGDALLSKVKQYGFDGIDIDYEFPTTTSLQANFVMLMKYLREGLDAMGKENGKDYYLTMAVPGGAWAFSLFDMKSLAEVVDWFNIMNYDIYCNRGYALHHTPPYNNTLEGMQGASVADDIALYTSQGISKDKIVPGLGMYSRRWHGVEAGDNTALPGLNMPGQVDTSNIHYSELIYLYVNRNGYTRYWDDAAKAPYLYNAQEKIFISYDDLESVSYKADLVTENDCRGVMVFDYCTCDGVGFFEALDDMLD